MVQWTLINAPFKKSLHYCYLGTIFEGGKAWAQGRMTKAWKEQQTKGRGAMFAFISNHRTHHSYTPYIVSQLLIHKHFLLWGLAVKFGDRVLS
jgi:hypothetical protein